MKIESYDPAKKRYVLCGLLINGTFTKNVRRSVHLFRISSSYGIQEDVIKTLAKHKCQKVVIVETDTGVKYEQDFLYWQHVAKKADYGNGKQYFLSLQYMKKI